jgi:hypothetical protein
VASALPGVTADQVSATLVVERRQLLQQADRRELQSSYEVAIVITTESEIAATVTSAIEANPSSLSSTYSVSTVTVPTLVATTAAGQTRDEVASMSMVIPLAGGIGGAVIALIVFCLVRRRCRRNKRKPVRAPIQPLSGLAGARAGRMITGELDPGFSVCAGSNTTSNAMELSQMPLTMAPTSEGVAAAMAARSRVRSAAAAALPSEVSQPLGSPRSPREKFRDRSKSVGSNKTSPVVPPVVPLPEEKKGEPTVDPTAEFI